MELRIGMLLKRLSSFVSQGAVWRYGGGRCLGDCWAWVIGKGVDNKSYFFGLNQNHQLCSNYKRFLRFFGNLQLRNFPKC